MIAGRAGLVMIQDLDGRTALHYACFRTSSVQVLVVSYLTTEGGLDVLFMTDGDGMTALHVACHLHCPSREVIMALVQIGGMDLVMVKDLRERNALDL